MNARAQAQCTPSCVHYRSFLTTGLEGPSCVAFPTGIPDEVWENRFDHRNVHPDQVGEVVWTGTDYPTYALAVEPTLTAAADVMEGAMIALVPSPADLERLAIPGGEPVEQLHLALLFLGDAADIDQETRDALIAWAHDLAPSWDNVEGDGFGVGVFNPTGDEPCVVVIVGGSDVAEMHETTLADANDVMDLPEQHVPFVPHVTLVYLQAGMDDPAAGSLPERTGPIVFDRIRLAFGGDVTDVPLGRVSARPPEIVVELPVEDATPEEPEPVVAAAGPLREVWDGPLH